MLNQDIFRTYDIRGIVSEDFSKDSVEKIAQAFGTYLVKHGTRDSLVGHDVRTSSTSFSRDFVKGLLSTGVNVHFVGPALTSGIYYARHHYNIDGGAMITASHNPPHYNGFKLCHGLKCIHSEELKSLYSIIQKGEFAKGQGSLQILETSMDEYLKAIQKRIQLKRKLKVVVDCGNGTGGIFVPRLFREMGCEVISLYADTDGKFPNHIPDPVNLETYDLLIQEVKKQKADIGLMLDGDGDRVGTVDNEGNIWLGDMILIALMKDFLPAYPGAKVIVEVKNSEAVVDECKRLGGIPIFWKTGHALLDQKVAEEKAILCGEMSCHFWVTPDWYVFDDGLFAVSHLMRIISEQNKSYAKLMSDIPQYPSTPEYRVACPEDKKADVVQRAKEYFQEKCTKVIDVDGIRGYYGDGWFLIRKSNTQPIISVRCEARTKKGLEKIKDFVQNHLNSNPDINLDWNRQYDAK